MPLIHTIRYERIVPSDMEPGVSLLFDGLFNYRLSSHVE